ncbi:hypothetical protein C1645_837827 [Glomus cerebriforme]|uniref:Uncharacterized protein n=1 Tax=Glomus cerebriforme TaxID=658196 RepID=A0A397S872_9GLOM|nr:hypothetical protein C1645_837827 [Glomus cerebriforme]
MTTSDPILPLTLTSLSMFSAERYNNLPNIEYANNELKKRTNFNEFLEKVFAITLESKIELGLRLIHKHISLKDDKAMIEKYTEFNNKPALITSADFVDEKTYPASWLLNKDKTLSVFEYSRDLHVIRTLNKVVKDPLPFRNICQLIRQYHFESLLAPCVHARDAMVHFDKEQVFVERTYSNLFASVIQNETSDTANSYINTLYGAPITADCIERQSCNYDDDEEQHMTTYWHEEVDSPHPNPDTP